mgnify:CR=1 FL=1
MNILFVASQGSRKQISPIIQRQAESLLSWAFNIKFFLIANGLQNYLRSIWLLRKELNKDSSIDLIHAHYGLCGIVAFLANHGKHSLIVSFMGDDIIGSVGKNNKYTLMSKCISKLNIFFARNLYDYSIVKSSQMHSKIGQNYKCTTIPNGVDINFFKEKPKNIARDKLGLRQNLFYVIFVSNPSRIEKNYKLAVSSVNSLGRLDIKLLAVYDIAKELLPYYYSAADFLLMTSYHEGSPNVIKEAMACNCPIVTTDVGDVRYILGNTDGCFIAEANPKDLHQKIIKALDYARAKNRTQGRKRIMEIGLDSDSIVRRIIDVYSNVMEK